jgi:hypothetical protein
LPICGNSYSFSTELVRLRGQKLNSRTYIFGNEQEDYDKIQGVKTHPYALPPKKPLFVFVFKESERASGNELFRALIGKGYMIVVIGYSFNDSHINGLLGQALRAADCKLLVVDTRDDYTTENNSDKWGYVSYGSTSEAVKGADLVLEKPWNWWRNGRGFTAIPLWQVSIWRRTAQCFSEDTYRLITAVAGLTIWTL